MYVKLNIKLLIDPPPHKKIDHGTFVPSVDRDRRPSTPPSTAVDDAGSAAAIRQFTD